MSHSVSQAILEFDSAALESPSNAACLPNYAACRDSGISWFGAVPSHWAIEKLKFIARAQFSNVDKKSEEGEQPVRLCNYVDVYYHDRITADIEFMEATAEPREAVKFQLQAGDVLITKDSEDPNDICVPAVVAESLPGVLCGYHLAQVRPDPKRTHGPYLMYAFRSSGIRDQFRMRANGITRFGLSQDDICSALFPLPTLPEQRAIAGWLDERTRRIDGLVAAKRRLIGLLTEQRTALISHAVTKGLNPAAPMKPSGIDWLGDVPGHWAVSPMYARYSVELGKMLDAKQITGDHLVPYIRNVDVRWDSVNVDDLPEMDIESHEYNRFILQSGDMVACEGGEVGRAAFWRGELGQCAYQKAIHRIRPLKPAQDYPRFLYYVMYTGSKCGVFIAGGNPNTIPHLTGEALRVYRFAFPPIDEQRAIVAHLDVSSAKLDALTAAAETAIARLTEYRQALISAAVTGKINVCGAISAAAVEESPAAISTEAPAHAAQAPAIASRIAGQPRGANKHFRRTVLAAQIIATIGDKPTFGRVKLQKAMILTEYHLRIDEIQSEPVRAAAGPFDNQMMQSVHAQLKRSQWYAYDQARHGAKYGALAKAGGHAEYFDRYWSDRRTGFDALMKTLDPMTTEQAEIVATLYAAWNDFMIDGVTVTDDALVAEVSMNWHLEKAKITETQWRAALPWMRLHGLVPTGFGASTRKVSTEATPRSRT